MLGVLRQTAIYRAGVSGRRPRVPTDATQLEARARKAMPAEAYAYIAGGAGTGATVRANRDGFDRWRIVPRMLRDVSERDTWSSCSGAGSRRRSCCARSACSRWSTTTPTWPSRAPPAPSACR